MTLADDLQQARAALTMIHGEPFNAEAPPEALIGDITPTELHYVRSNFSVPVHDGTPRGRRRGRTSQDPDARRPACHAAGRAGRHDGMRRERAPGDATPAGRRTMGGLRRLHRSLDRCPAVPG